MKNVAALLALAACGRLHFADRAPDASATADALDAAALPCVTWSAWSTPTVLPGPIQSTSDDWSAAPFLGGTEVVFYSYRPGMGGGDLYRATRASTADMFSAATPITELNTTFAEGSAGLPDDGLEIIYEDNTSGVTHMWTASRQHTSDPFGGIQILPAISATDPSFDSSPSLDGAGLRLVFVSNRAGASALFESARVDRASPFQTPVKHAELGPMSDSPTLSPDGLDIYFETNRSGGWDIWSAHRDTLGGTFAAPAIVPELSSSADDGNPRFGADPATLYCSYSSTFSGGANAELSVATRTCLN